MKPLPLTAAAVLVLVALWRAQTRRLPVWQVVAGAVVFAALVVYGAGLIELPKAEEVIRDLGAALGPWTYALVGALAFLETGAFVGLLAPGETTILFGGVVAGQGQIDVVVLIGLVWAAAVAGDTVSFFVGRRLGRDFLVRHGPRVKITPERLEQVEGFFARHGGKAILLGRFIGLVRAVLPFVAGTSGMRFRRFVPYDVIGAGLWGTVFVLLGYVFWQSFDQVAGIAGRGSLALGTTIALAVGGVWLTRTLRDAERRARLRTWLLRQAETPAGRPLARLARPLWRHAVRPASRRLSGPARWTWNRLTPGELGLEVTTLTAIAAVGAFSFASLATLISRRTVIDADLTALDLGTDLRAQVVLDIAKVGSEVGSAPVVGAVVLVTLGLLVWRRHAVDAAALLAGTALTWIAVDIAKAAEDRPRPVGPLVETAGSSFPSGHAAYSVVLIAAAVALGRVVPRFAARFALVTVAVIAAVGIGLTRVYLRAHFLTDVLAGWALAAAILAPCGIVALAVSFAHRDRGIRHTTQRES